MTVTPPAAHHAGERIDGFVVRRVTPLKNLRSIAYEIEHEKTGARILHLHNDDAENLFSVTFPTPPPDDTGVPHILEHCVLAGSKKYPVKDPFFEMLKSSMATFINAMTGSDYTVYPVSSNVRQDFYNLAEVYWDAVFHPNLTEPTFQREGHHLELANKTDPASELIIKGIVYNEMKGARSSPDSKVYDVIEKKLWPDTPLGKDSGGDPEHIPELTYDEFRDFHASYYHPSNGYFFLYGDIPTADHLQFLREKLAVFNRTSVSAEVPPQPRWREPRSYADVYPIGKNDPTSGKTYVVLNWLVGDATDLQDLLALGALERVLLGNQGAPLRKVLIDSKLGEDLTHSGLWTNGRESSFHVGLKGSEAERAGALLDLVLGTLKKVADDGIHKERVDAAFQQLAYRNLEINSNYPLHLMGRATGVWLHGADPLDALRADEQLEALKRRYEADPQMFSRLIRERLLNNPHRLTITVSPDRDVQAKKDADFSRRMRELKASLAPAQLQKIVQTQELIEEQLNAPNPPEALATLPTLKVRDLPPKPRHIPTTVEKLDGGVELLKNDVFANGVNYLHVSFDLSGLPQEMYGYLPVYSDCVHKMGAAGLDYVKTAERVAAHTGGVGFSVPVSTSADESASVRRGTFTMKFLDGKADAALAVLRDLIFQLDPRDADRLGDVILQERAYHRTRPASDGLGIATRHAGRGFNVESLLNEIMHGLPQTRLVEELARGDREALMARLEAVRNYLIARGQPAASFTGSDAVFDRVRKTLAGWGIEMGKGANGSAGVSFEPYAAPPREGLAAPMNVAYCTMVMPAPHLSHADAPLLMVGGRLLGLGYVLEEVRFKGTAYGGGCSYHAAQRKWEFYSYRDPWVNRTLDVYRGAKNHVASAGWSQADVDRAIIGTAKEGERPIRPADATGTALWRYLTGDTPERREARHAAILRATPKDVKRALLDVLESGIPKAAVCVVSSREKLEEANRERPETPLAIEEILPST